MVVFIPSANVTDNQLLKEAIAHTIKHFYHFSMASTFGLAYTYFATKLIYEFLPSHKYNEKYILLNYRYNIRVPYWMAYWVCTSSSAYWLHFFASRL